MCWHIADPDFFWDKDKIPQNFKNKGWCYSDSKYVSYDKLITYAYDLIKRHPKLHVLLAHAFFKSNEPKEVDALLKNNPNVCIDLAPGSEMFDGFRKNYDDWYSIFRKHSNRFLFATDGTGSNLERITTLTNNVLRFLQTDDEFNFNTLYVAKGIKLENEYLENSVIEMEIIDEVRRQNGTVFPADDVTEPAKADYVAVHGTADNAQKEEESL
jgi:hypothetical protein